jgi:Rap1a immunity proteins
MPWGGVFARVIATTLLTLSHVTAVSAITADEFRLRSGTDFVALCETPATDPLYMAAVHMCHGFGAGTYQTIQALTRHEKLAPVICPPEPPPSRNETVSRLLEWSRRNAQYQTEPPAEMVARFFISEFPCRAK